MKEEYLFITDSGSLYGAQKQGNYFTFSPLKSSIQSAQGKQLLFKGFTYDTHSTQEAHPSQIKIGMRLWAQMDDRRPLFTSTVVRVYQRKE